MSSKTQKGETKDYFSTQPKADQKLEMPPESGKTQAGVNKESSKSSFVPPKSHITENNLKAGGEAPKTVERVKESTETCLCSFKNIGHQSGAEANFYSSGTVEVKFASGKVVKQRRMDLEKQMQMQSKYNNYNSEEIELLEKVLEACTLVHNTLYATVNLKAEPFVPQKEMLETAYQAPQQQFNYGYNQVSRPRQNFGNLSRGSNPYSSHSGSFVPRNEEKRRNSVPSQPRYYGGSRNQHYDGTFQPWMYQEPYYYGQPVYYPVQMQEYTTVYPNEYGYQPYEQVPDADNFQQNPFPPYQ